ncbi:hypothetical protein D9Q98_004755 [Chlorella vulgaris]|uniref:Uncharacterized protein n=1 Tax=Chlorella vulgaris TaxID=3077 RepID=A0A9D4TQL7_CHLVU|nr:hypothetical protein D9Q98_004755 [Chlorella vulgaris]
MQLRTSTLTSIAVQPVAVTAPLAIPNSSGSETQDGGTVQDLAVSSSSSSSVGHSSIGSTLSPPSDAAAHGGRHSAEQHLNGSSAADGKVGAPVAVKLGIVTNADNAGLACNQALAIKKVALLFLTTRRLAHEKLWRLWMWEAAGLVPQQALHHLQRQLCEAPAGAAAGAWQRVRAACAPQPTVAASTAAGRTEMPHQHLFSIYVHAPPDYKGLQYQPLFQGHVLPQRLRTWWGTSAITDAERLLLAAALSDPSNDRFVLVSDHDIPLYDPLTFYQQLMHEPRSRTRACPIEASAMSIERWRDGMATGRLKKHHWRKSSQFFALGRAHAEAVMRDREVYRSFKERCGSQCVPDEHYIPTLLAVLGLQNETYCNGNGIAYVDWSRGGNHPRSFKPKEISVELLHTMRRHCTNSQAVTEDARRMFMATDELVAIEGDAQQVCRHLQAVGSSSSSSGSNGSNYARPLAGWCPLTARKFPPFTSLRIRQLFLSSCPPGTGKQPSKAALAISFPRDPQLTLFSGQACTVGVQKVLGAEPAAAAGSGKERRRRLLCTLWSSASRLLPAADSGHPPFLDSLDDMCENG